MEHKQKKLIKVVYYTDPCERVYEVDENINVDKLCEEERNYQTFNQIEFQHHGQFREILVDNTWGWNDSVDSDSQFTYENYRVEQVEDEQVELEDPEYILSIDSKSGDLYYDHHRESPMTPYCLHSISRSDQ
jgi:hypothetical protein